MFGRTRLPRCRRSSRAWSNSALRTRFCSILLDSEGGIIARPRPGNGGEGDGPRGGAVHRRGAPDGGAAGNPNRKFGEQRRRGAITPKQRCQRGLRFGIGAVNAGKRRDFSASTGERGDTRTGWLRGQSRANPSPTSNSLFHGKIQGIVRFCARSSSLREADMPEIPRVSAGNSLSAEQGIFGS